MNFPITPAFADSITVPVLGGFAPHQLGRTKHISSDIQAFLVGGISEELIVAQPLPITIEQDEDGTYIASDDIFLMYGVGDTRPDALNDYVASLIAYFYVVKKSAETNKFDYQLLNQLQSYIQRRGSNAIQTNRS